MITENPTFFIFMDDNQSFERLKELKAKSTFTKDAVIFTDSQLNDKSLAETYNNKKDVILNAYTFKNSLNSVNKDIFHNMFNVLCIFSEDLQFSEKDFFQMKDLAVTKNDNVSLVSFDAISALTFMFIKDLSFIDAGILLYKTYKESKTSLVPTMDGLSSGDLDGSLNLINIGLDSIF